MTNAEKYKTAEERMKAYAALCENHRDCENCPAHTGSAYPQCAFHWLELDAEEEKPLPCPFCGENKIDIFETDFGLSDEPYVYVVKCFSCKAIVSAGTKAEAIAAWNRREK